MNNTLEEDILDYRDSATKYLNITRPILVAVQLILFILGHGNLMVMFLIARNESLRSITNLYSINLCISDYLYCILLPFWSSLLLYGSWPFDTFACKAYWIFEATGKYASVIFITVLSFDRYLALCHPGWCKKNRCYKLAALIATCAWCLVICFVTPIAVFAQVRTIPNTTIKMCTISWPSPTSGTMFMTAAFSITFAIPSLLIVICYVLVLKKLVEATRRSKALNRTRSLSSRSKPGSERRYKKVTRTVLSVITFYILCWTPFWLQNMVTSHVHFPNFRQNFELKILFNIIHMLPYVNCALNPYLHAYLSEDFKTAFQNGMRKLRMRRLSSAVENGYEAIGIEVNEPQKPNPHKPLQRTQSILTYTATSRRCSTYIGQSVDLSRKNSTSILGPRPVSPCASRGIVAGLRVTSPLLQFDRVDVNGRLSPEPRRLSSPAGRGVAASNPNITESCLSAEVYTTAQYRPYDSVTKRKISTLHYVPEVSCEVSSSGRRSSNLCARKISEEPSTYH